MLYMYTMYSTVVGNTGWLCVSGEGLALDNTLVLWDVA